MMKKIIFCSIAVMHMSSFCSQISTEEQEEVLLQIRSALWFMQVRDIIKEGMTEAKNNSAVNDKLSEVRAALLAGFAGEFCDKAYECIKRYGVFKEALARLAVRTDLPDQLKDMYDSIEIARTDMQSMVTHLEQNLYTNPLSDPEISILQQFPQILDGEVNDQARAIFAMIGCIQNPEIRLQYPTIESLRLSPVEKK